MHSCPDWVQPNLVNLSTSCREKPFTEMLHTLLWLNTVLASIDTGQVRAINCPCNLELLIQKESGTLWKATGPYSACSGLIKGSGGVGECMVQLLKDVHMYLSKVNLT